MFHLLDDTYRPVGHPEADAMPPAYPSRVKAFVYGCALVAEDDAIERVKATMGVSSTRAAMGAM